jgi:hypothetical protein
MSSEIEYKINVEPAMFTILSKIGVDVQGFGVSSDDFTRALWTYADQRLDEYDTVPQWLWQELENKRRAAEASNTVDGEVEGGS